MQADGHFGKLPGHCHYIVSVEIGAVVEGFGVHFLGTLVCCPDGRADGGDGVKEGRFGFGGE